MCMRNYDNWKIDDFDRYLYSKEKKKYEKEQKERKRIKIKTAVISAAVTACFLISLFVLIIDRMAEANAPLNSDYYVFVIPGDIRIHEADCTLIMDNNDFVTIKLSEALALRYQPCPLCHKKSYSLFN